MKIAIDTRGATLYHGTGIGTYTENIINEFLKISRLNEFYLFCCGNFNKNFISKNSHIIYSSGKKSTFYNNFYIPDKIFRNNIDIYHIPQNGIGLNKCKNAKNVVTIHDLIPYIMPETVGSGYLKKFLEDMPHIIADADGILTVSEYSKKDILKYFSFYPENKIFVTPLAASKNYVPLNKKYCKKFVENKFNVPAPYILYIGGFSPRKNVIGLINAFKHIYKDLNANYKLLICGSLKDEGLRLYNYVKEINMDKNIIFTGFIEDDLLPILYNSADTFVYPSLYEGFGLPPLEAMSCKTAVITSNVTSIPEVTSDSAILINPLKENELEEALLKTLNDSLFRMSLAEKGYQRSLNFTWEKTAQKTLSAYKKILEE
ncbi:glycosyltransferase family 1 protein [Clostridium sp. BJN0001]|uniref:glycosyltransferase family 4 protein n=1 Tax=Clostridium sp. BJN0001 TaxID=2930219 RepID=UPI001FD3D7AF|nr:glycosyltransferase family 1 protein [Clostridium sp. BJN0001]